MTSIVLSVALTVILNLGLRLFPGGGQRAQRRLSDFAEREMARTDRGGSRVRVFFPWRAMLIGSIVLTVVVNLLVRAG